MHRPVPPQRLERHPLIEVRRARPSANRSPIPVETGNRGVFRTPAPEEAVAASCTRSCACRPGFLLRQTPEEQVVAAGKLAARPLGPIEQMAADDAGEVAVVIVPLEDAFARQLFHVPGDLAAAARFRQFAAQEVRETAPIGDVQDRGMEQPQMRRS